MTTSPEVLLDFDAEKRASKYPDGFPLRLNGQVITLPSELPVDVMDPFLADDLDLVGLFKDALTDRKKHDGEDSDESLGELVLDLLLGRPTLPKQLIEAIKQAVALLFGDEHDKWLAARPSVNDYLRLVRGVFPLYGVTLGEAFASPASSETGGATQKPTSSASTESEPATSGDDQATPSS